MSSRLTAGEASAVDRVDPDLVRRYLERLRRHGREVRTLGLVELSSLCALFTALDGRELGELLELRLALGSFADRHPALEVGAVAAAFVEAVEAHGSGSPGS